MRRVETAIAFAGEEWAILMRFLGTEVMAVSAVPCWGCAEVVLVSTSPCFCLLCAKFVALPGLMWVRARNSSPCVLTMDKNWRLMVRWASFFADMLLEAPCRGSFFAHVGTVVTYLGWSEPIIPSVNPTDRTFTR